MANPTYIFPEKIAARMATISPKVQYEASMMGTTMMALGLIVTAIYFVFFFDFAWWYNIVIVINVLAGLFVMFASVTTTYQQYLAYLQAMQLHKQLARSPDMPEVVLTPSKIRWIRYPIGTLAVLVGVRLFYEGFSIGWDTWIQWVVKTGLFVVGLTIGSWGIYKVLSTERFIHTKYSQNEKGGTENG